MSNEQNWRTDVTGLDYFGRQKKQLQVADRRPVIRRASDLVGPGISATAVRIADFNDQLGTYNGYYSAAAGTANAPTPDEAFIGHVASDADLGGEQVFRGLTTGIEYQRVFLRNPSDPSSLTWGAWNSGSSTLDSATASNAPQTSVPSGVTTYLTLPTLTGIGDYANAYGVSGSSLTIRKPGVYTGYVHITTYAGGSSMFQYFLQHPNDAGSSTISRMNSVVGDILPFTFYTTVTTQLIRAQLYQSLGATVTATVSHFQITRIGNV